MKTLVVTGLIGSGKSAVCALLERRGIPVYNADERTKRLYDRRPSLVSRLEKVLGVPLRRADGSLDRQALSGVIFRDAAAREKLEALVYPLVLQDFKRWRARQKEAPFVVLESAVILSKPLFDSLADAVVLVSAPEPLRLQRVMERDGLPETAVRARMQAQSIPEEKVDVVLSNEGNHQQLSRVVEQVFFDNNSYICKLINKQ